ncbi:Pyruvate/Phosphoenolpyruvate kinase-like domain containing protein [Rhypophila decipiens]
MEVNQAAAKLRAQLADPDQIIVCPGVQDGLSARVCLHKGFKNLYMTGAGTSISLLGQPDLGLTPVTDMIRNASMIASLDRSVPLIADADTGFGGPLMVSRTVESYILAGVAALHLEDQVLTKRCGHLGGKEIVDIETFVSRIRAAHEVRKRLRSEIVLIARSDALSATLFSSSSPEIGTEEEETKEKKQERGFQEAVKRLKSAVQAGADVAFFEGLQTRDQMRRVVGEMAPTPCLLNMVPGGVTPLISAREAKEMGFKIVIWPCFAMTAAYLAYQRAADELLCTGEIKEPEDRRGGVKEIFEVCGLSECVEFDKLVGGSAFRNGV